MAGRAYAIVETVARHARSSLEVSCPMPALTMDRAEVEEVLKHWRPGATISLIKPGSGTANASVIVEVADERLLLRRRNRRYANEDWVRFDHALFAHLREAGVAAPPAVKAPNGRSWLRRGDDIYELFHVVEGEAHQEGDPTELESAGRMLARIHSEAADFDPPAPKPWPRFHDPKDALAGLEELLTLAAGQQHPAERLETLECARALADDLVERVSDEAYWSLPQTVVHGDYHAGNLKFRDGRVVGVFDWDWSSRQPRMVDLADGLLFLCGRRTEPLVPGDIWSLTSAFELDFERMDAFAQGYGAIVEPELPETRLLPDLMRCRWLYCRVDAALRKVEPARRVEFVVRDFTLPLEGIDALESLRETSVQEISEGRERPNDA